MNPGSVILSAVLLCALFSGSITAQGEATWRPPTNEFDCSSRPNGLYPNPNNCKTFFKCSNGLAYPYDCPAELDFNPDLLVCDWPENAGCSAGQTTLAPTTQATTTKRTTTTERPISEDFDCSDKPSGVYPNPEDCRTFYKCSNGNAYLYNCPANLHFNPTLLVCDWPENAGCQVGVTTPAPTTPAPTTQATTTKATTRPPTGDFDCSDKPSGLYPNPEDCRTFYKCSNGYAYLYDCPANLHFNPTLLVCDWPENAGCSAGQTTPAPTTQAPTTQAPTTTRPPTGDFDCSNKPSGLYPNPEDCRTFYKCSNGYAYLYDCPANLHFNPTLLVCDWPENAGCQVGVTTQAPTTQAPTTQAPTTTRPPTGDFDCSDKPSGLYPNPEDCRTFYKCSNGYAYLYDCPANLHFNPTLLVCDWPENAGCQVGVTTQAPTTQAPTTQAPTTTRPPTGDFDCSDKPSGLYPNPEDCRTFYKCSNGIAYLYDCPANLHFNPTLLVCDWPENAGCQVGVTTQAPTTQAPTTQAPTTTRPPTGDFDCSDKPSGLYPNPEDCRTFYKCSNGIAYLYDCPANLHFNPTLLVCDWPENAGCQVGVTTQAPTTQAPTTQAPTTTRPPTGDFDCSDKPSGLYPNPEDCRTFYKCSNGIAYLYDCPANLHFNPTLLVCDWPENAGCQVGVTTQAPTTQAPTTQAPTTTKPPTGDFDCSDKPSGLYPNPEDCRTFYKCSNGIAYLYDCPANLHFNPTLLVCDWPENAGCQVGVTTQAPTTQAPTTQAPTTTRPPTGDFDCSDKPSGLYPNPEDCRTFYKCSNGIAYLYDCPANLHFNPTLLVCDWPENAGCQVGVTTQAPTTQAPTTQAPTTTRPPTGDFDCSDKPSGLYPNPEDCRTFYKCSNGIAYLYDCPANLHFNPTLLVCDWPENAGCQVGVTTPAPTTQAPTTQAPTTTRPPTGDFDCSDKPSGLYPNPEDCRTFYKCSNGIAYLYDCPANLHFNPTLLVCDWPENAGCQVGVTTQAPTTQAPTTQAPTTTRPPTGDFDCSGKPSGLYPNPEDCRTFYKCSNGLAYLYSCPANLHFNPTLLVCDWPENAGCSVTQAPTTEAPTEPPTTQAPPESGFNCTDRPCGLYPDPESCNRYIQCSEGEAIIRECPEPLLFNPDIQSCDLPQNVDCGFSCENRENGNYQNLQNCRTFYSCSNGYKYLFNCQETLVYHPDENRIGWCDYEDNASQFCVNGELD